MYSKDKRKNRKTFHSSISTCNRSSACFQSNTDVSSVRSLQTTGSRKSERIAQRPAVSYEDSVHKCTTFKSQYLCDVIDCNAACDTVRGLNIHKAKCHHTTMQESMRSCNQKRSSTVVDAESQSIQTKHLTALHTSLK